MNVKAWNACLDRADYWDRRFHRARTRGDHTAASFFHSVSAHWFKMADRYTK